MSSVHSDVDEVNCALHLDAAKRIRSQEKPADTAFSMRGARDCFREAQRNGRTPEVAGFLQRKGEHDLTQRPSVRSPMRRCGRARDESLFPILAHFSHFAQLTRADSTNYRGSSSAAYWSEAPVGLALPCR
jgi:hypothetical protein